MNSFQEKEYKKRVNDLLNPSIRKRLVTCKEITGFNMGELWQMGFEKRCKELQEK